MSLLTVIAFLGFAALTFAVGMIVMDALEEDRIKKEKTKSQLRKRNKK